MKFTKDMIVAMAIHANEPILQSSLLKSLDGMSEKEMLKQLRYLADIGIVISEFTDEGRIYFISTEANQMIGDTRILYEAQKINDTSRLKKLWRKIR